MQIEEVFTPRNKDVNETMYISREENENDLVRAHRSHINAFLFGESGNGKSWLYKHTFKKYNIGYTVVNGANVARCNSIVTQIYSDIMPKKYAEVIEYTEEKKAKLGIGIADAEVKHTDKHIINQEDLLITAFQRCKKNNVKVVVIDNLEAIYGNEKLMDELANLVLLLDEERYAIYGVKFLLVGLPKDILEYFRKTKNMESVSNRLEELNKINGLSETQVGELVNKGFRLLDLKVKLYDLPIISKHIYHVTMGIAQRVHEYCQRLAYVMVDEPKLSLKDMLDKADEKWLTIALRQSYSVIESHFNNKKTKIARKNQVIFCIGRTIAHQFDASVIESKIKEFFKETVPTSGSMGVSQILKDLTESDKPLLKFSKETGCYSVVDPRHLMCIRLAIVKTNDENYLVRKRSFLIN